MRAKGGVLLAMTACLLAAPVPFRAQTIVANAAPALPAGAETRIGRYVQLVVDDTGHGLAAGGFDFPVNPAVTTIVIFPQEVQYGAGAPDPYFKIDIDGNRVAISPRRRGLKQGIQRNVTLFCASLSVSLMLSPTDEPSDAVVLAVVTTRSLVERWKAESASILAEQQGEQKKDARKRANLDLMDRFLHTASFVKPGAVEGDVAPHRPGASAVTIHGFEGAWVGPDDMYLRFSIENNGDRAFALGEARALGPDRIEDHAGAVRVLTTAAPAEGSGKGLIGKIPARSSTQAVIHVERARAIGGPLTIMLSEPGGARPVTATLRNWVPMALQPVHDVRMWEFRPVEPPDPEKGKVSLHLQGVFGAIWLGDGTGADLTDATSLKGLGMRAQYAFNRYIAVEGELMGASTGTARFADVTYQEAQGDLARSASLGRMQFGGVLRLGEQYVPILRLGVGLQGASHSGTLTTAAGEQPGPDPFEFDLLWYAGVGMDIRVGPLVAGLSLAGAKGEGQSIEAGIHLGYAWKP